MTYNFRTSHPGLFLQPWRSDNDHSPADSAFALTVKPDRSRGALTRFPILCDLLSCGMLIGRLARHWQRFQAALKAGEKN
jgi:hypothetical protein